MSFTKYRTVIISFHYYPSVLHTNYLMCMRHDASYSAPQLHRTGYEKIYVRDIALVLTTSSHAISNHLRGDMVYLTGHIVLSHRSHSISHRSHGISHRSHGISHMSHGTISEVTWYISQVIWYISQVTWYYPTGHMVYLTGHMVPSQRSHGISHRSYGTTISQVTLYPSQRSHSIISQVTWKHLTGHIV